jgi:uncharacterized protein (DUF1800 family)
MNVVRLFSRAASQGRLAALVIMLLSVGSFAEGASPRSIPVDPQNVFTVPFNGKVVTCALIRGKYHAGRLRPRSRFITVAHEIQTLRSTLRALPASKRKRANARIATLRDQNRLCTSGPPAPPPEPTPSPTPQPTPNVFALRTTPLTVRDIHYLYEKAALGAVSPEVQSVGLTHGVEALVDRMLTVVPDAALESESAKYLDENYGQDSTGVTNRGIQQWALYRLVRSSNPFHERFAFLFLHNLLATSNDVLSSTQKGLMRDQLLRLLSHAYSSSERYPQLVEDISRDPAMLIWLNGDQNTRFNPNENFARELMELFTLGTTNLDGESNYSEATVAQVARACTGWTVQQVNAGQGQMVWSAVLQYFNHDDRPDKVIFENTPHTAIVTDDREVITHIFASHPAADEYLALRLLREYLTDDPSPDLVRAFAAEVRKHDFRLKDALRTLFASEIFYSPKFRNSIVKHPVERAVEALRRTQIPFNLVTLQRGLEGGGQELGRPPSVFGWKNSEWANGQWLLALSNTMTAIIRDTTLFQAQDPPWSYDRLFPHPQPTPEELVNHFEQLFGVTLSDSMRQTLITYLTTSRNGAGVISSQPFNPSSSSLVRTKVAGLVEIFFRLTDFQMR